MTKTPENVPKALEAMADIVLAYKPKPKTKGAKKRKKHAARVARKASLSPIPPKAEEHDSHN
jgi:hypothetical protein